MGHGMAKNIRQKISNDSTVVVYDINHSALEQFVKDFSRHGPIIAAGSPKEVAEIAVCDPIMRGDILILDDQWIIRLYRRISS